MDDFTCLLRAASFFTAAEESWRERTTNYLQFAERLCDTFRARFLDTTLKEGWRDVFLIFNFFFNMLFTLSRQCHKCFKKVKETMILTDFN